MLGIYDPWVTAAFIACVLFTIGCVILSAVAGRSSSK